MAKRYSTEEVQDILVRAMEKSHQEGFSRSQLEEMAADIGISSDALAWAEQDCQELATPAQSNTIQKSKRSYFFQRFRTYAVVNVFLLALNLALSGTITWAIYPLLGWGMGLLLPEQLSPCVKRERS